MMVSKTDSASTTGSILVYRLCIWGLGERRLAGPGHGI